MIWLCRSDPINFSMPYGQIADLNLTLCSEESNIRNGRCGNLMRVGVRVMTSFVDSQPTNQPCTSWYIMLAYVMHASVVLHSILAPLAHYYHLYYYVPIKWWLWWWLWKCGILRNEHTISQVADWLTGRWYVANAQGCGFWDLADWLPVSVILSKHFHKLTSLWIDWLLLVFWQIGPLIKSVVYHSVNSSSHSVNGDITIQWEWSNFDHS